MFLVNHFCSALHCVSVYYLCVCVFACEFVCSALFPVEYFCVWRKKKGSQIRTQLAVVWTWLVTRWHMSHAIQILSHVSCWNCEYVQENVERDVKRFRIRGVTERALSCLLLRGRTTSWCLLLGQVSCSFRCARAIYTCILIRRHIRIVS